jgi:Leu/Phe-tRNA-protein transferase
MRNQPDEPRPVSFALYLDNRLVAGDLGIRIGRVYTSYSGYHEENNAGTVQIILMINWLKEQNFALWDLGPWDNGYKRSLGAVDITPDEYRKIFAANA